MKIYFSVTLLMFFLSCHLHAMVMEDKDQGKIGFGFGELNVERSDGQRFQRYAYTVQYHMPLSGQGLGLDFGLLIAPDTEKRSQKVNIFHDMTTFYTLFNAHKVYYLRYNVSVGPGLQWSQVRYEFFKIKEKDHFFQPILLVDTSIDYAITQSWEIGAHVLWHWRDDFLRMDWGYRLVLQWSNIN